MPDMDLMKSFFRDHWYKVVALFVFAAAIIRYVYLAAWEANLTPFAAAALGFLCVVASNEVADWTGAYGWSHQQFRTYPVEFVSLAGGVALIVGTAVLYLR